MMTRPQPSTGYLNGHNKAPWLPLLFIGWVLMGTLGASEAMAARARIHNIAVEILDGQIVTSFELKNGWDRQIAQDIQDGIAKDFYYYLLLSQKYEEWFDKEVVEKTLRYTVKYDTVKQIYTVDRSYGEDRKTQAFDRLEAMQAFIFQAFRIPVASQTLLKPHERYFVRVKAQMKGSHVPLALDRFLFFIPFLELDTPWAQSGSIFAP